MTKAARAARSGRRGGMKAMPATAIKPLLCSDSRSRRLISRGVDRRTGGRAGIFNEQGLEDHRGRSPGSYAGS